MNNISFDLDRSNKIPAIKKLRELSDWGLKEAKDAIDNVCKNTTGNVSIFWCSPMLIAVCSGAPHYGEWKIVIRDKWDEYNFEEHSYNGSEEEAQKEAGFFATKNPEHKVYLYKAISQTVMPKLPVPTITKL